MRSCDKYLPRLRQEHLDFRGPASVNGGMANRVSRTATTPWEELSNLSTPELRQKWIAMFGTEQTPKLKRELLIGALAYQLQVEKFGGLKARTRRRLRELAENPDIAVTRQPDPLPGTQLIREWRGTTHVVEVGADGFYWRRTRFASLSAIAREITGTRWSGPRFFGVKGGASEAAS